MMRSTMFVLLLAMLVPCLMGCEGSSKKAPKATNEDEMSLETRADVKKEKASIRKARHQLDMRESRADARDEELDRERWKQALGWATGIGIFGALACVVLFFVVPSGRKWWVGLFIGCIALIAGAWLLKVVLEYLVPIAIALGVGIGAAVWWYLRQEKGARRELEQKLESKLRGSPELLQYFRDTLSKATKKIIKMDRKHMKIDSREDEREPSQA